MRKLTKIFLFAALMGLITVAATAHAVLTAFAPNPAVMPPGSGSPGVLIGGIPAWYQDINGVSVQPCLVPATRGLIGLGDPMFNEALLLSYPVNFPTAVFYFDVGAIFPVGPATARVVLALEYTFIDAVTGALITANPRPANALGVPFQRHSLIMTYPAGAAVPAAGNFTITHPCGATVFPFGSAKCVTAAIN
jgi:hypothetical protein